MCIFKALWARFGCQGLRAGPDLDAMAYLPGSKAYLLGPSGCYTSDWAQQVGLPDGPSPRCSTTLQKASRPALQAPRSLSTKGSLSALQAPKEQVGPCSQWLIGPVQVQLLSRWARSRCRSCPGKDFVHAGTRRCGGGGGGDSTTAGGGLVG